jgi:hypothetical protein
MSAYNIGDPRGVWLMFMELSGIKREILDDMERDLEQKLVSPNFDPNNLRSMSGFPKKYKVYEERYSGKQVRDSWRPWKLN